LQLQAVAESSLCLQLQFSLAGLTDEGSFDIFFEVDVAPGVECRLFFCRPKFNFDRIREEKRKNELLLNEVFIKICEFLGASEDGILVDELAEVVLGEVLWNIREYLLESDEQSFFAFELLHPGDHAVVALLIVFLEFEQFFLAAFGLPQLGRLLPLELAFKVGETRL
jgi:hypothetical protein